MIMAYIGQIFGPMRTMTQTASTLSNALASAERVYQVLDQPPEVDQSRSLRPLVRASGAVEYDRVTFGYEDGSRVLDEVSFRVEPGTRVGIQGPTGAGKTTLIGLMMRFYDPQSGSIRLDGIDVRELRLHDLRDQFAIVLQDPVLFARSIAENIAYGRPGASRDEVVAAAREANAHDFISALPDGYDSRVGERGMTLSGGERQRVALARAFLKNAPILILDEPTSALDRKTEAAVMDAIERLMRGRTTFIIAHRDWTLERCDVLFKLEGGSLRSAAGMTERAIAS
jgi:ATP-binding cassette subfamily B protein